MTSESEDLLRRVAELPYNQLSNHNGYCVFGCGFRTSLRSTHRDDCIWRLARKHFGLIYRTAEDCEPVCGPQWGDK